MADDKDNILGPPIEVTTKPQCPACKAVLDGATGIGNNMRKLPQGAISVCAYCTAILVYRGETFIEATPAMRAEWPMDVQMMLVGVRRAARAMIEERKRETKH